MTFAIQDAKLWNHINRSARQTLKLKEKSDNRDKDRKKYIYQLWKNIQDLYLNIIKTTTKISRMYSNIIQKKFLAMKNSTKWDPKKLWDWLKKCYTFQNFVSK